MSAPTQPRLFVAVALLALAALACNRSAAGLETATAPSPATLPPLPTIPTSTYAPALSPSPPAPPAILATHTPIPSPSPTPTPVIPSACPLLGNPVLPDRPASFDDYPGVLAAYLSAGGSAQGLTRLLRDWGAITDDAGDVRSLDMTGDMDPEIVVALIDPAPEFDLPWPPGDVFIFKCQGGALAPAYGGRYAVGQDESELQFTLYKIEDVNLTGRADAVYVTSSCGAHTCWDRMYIIEWDGAGFVNRVPDMTEYPYATFTLSDGRIVVDIGGIGSAGAGYQRSHSETWAWDGRQYALAEEVIGPPVALVHYVHDGDGALARGDYAGAIDHYQGALGDVSLPTGLFLESEEQGTAIVKAYARFKSVVAFASAGAEPGARAQRDLLMVEHPEGTPGHPFALLGQAFWGDFVANGAPWSACAAAVVLAESDPALPERLYAGYANQVYEPADLCRLAD